MPENELTMEEQLPDAASFELEHPHPSSKVEWWFFNGFFEGNTIGKRFFMVSFFRHNVADKTEKIDTGYSILFSILNPDTGKNRTLNQIDEKILNGFIELLQRDSSYELDPDLVEVLLNELKLHGPPKPILLKKAVGDTSGKTLNIKWDEFSLSQHEKCFEVEFPLLEGDKSCFIQLYPEYERSAFEVTDGNPLEDGKVPYHCYPELRLSGTAGDEEINGQAWMDHQWGNTGWFVSKGDQNKLLAWDWFGINLDDGTNLIVMIHKYAKTGEVVNSSSVLLQKSESPVFLEGVTAEPLEQWESPVTHIKYPVSWEINIEDLDLSLTFTPTVKDQEIPVFGVARAIWEGSGTVSGRMRGNGVTGRARAEFCGYGYIFDFQNYLKKLAVRVDERIEEFFPKEMDEEVIRKYVGEPHWKNEPVAYTEMISKPVWDLILRRGKRWRPIFGILMQEALGKSSLNYERGICLSELIHTGSLIVDDIEDQSELRRGQPTLHLKYGLDVALNAGNTLYFLPIVELFYHEHLNDHEKLKIHQVLMDTHLKAHFGQTLDIYWSRNMSLENLSKWFADDIESKILQMYDYKTAAGPKGIAELAAFFAGSDESVTEAAISFARSFAIAFQIVDDLLNFSNSSKWSKVCGEDISNGKLTYVIAKAIKLLEKKRSNRLQEILCDESLRRETETLTEAVKLVKESGALDESKKEAKKISLNAWKRFAEVVPSCEPKIMLNILSLKILDLAYDT